MTKKIKYDADTRRVLGFLKAKGLLLVDEIESAPTVKLDIAKVLKVGTEIEPRVIEVLPVALLHFPRTFINWRALPEKVKEVLAHIKKGAETGPDLAGIPYKAMKRWASLNMKDKRVKPISERRVMKSLRFRPTTIAALRKKAEAAGITETEFIERLIEG